VNITTPAHLVMSADACVFVTIWQRDDSMKALYHAVVELASLIPVPGVAAGFIASCNIIQVRAVE
jgi:hypothetical protein